MTHNLTIVITLLVCGICITSVSAVPVIVGFKDSSLVRIDSPVGVTFLTTPGAHGAPSTSGISVNATGHVFPDIHAVAADLSDEAIADLKASGTVRYVEPDYVVTALGPTIPWNIRMINADKVQAANITGTGVRVAVIDTGIDYTHPDLTGVYAGGYNIITNNVTGPMDDNGHGTHCAGILAATGSRNGIYGTAPGVRLYAVKVLSNLGEGRVSDVIAGIFWARNNSIQVASMSLGLDQDSQALHDAVDEASADGVLIVAAAGNRGVASGSGDTMTYPAKYDNVLSVAAVNKYNHRAPWSSTGNHLSISAPGVNIRSAIPGGYATYSGTSMAAPHVAGVAALVFSAHPDWTSQQVRQQIVSTATPLGRPSFYGAGLVNANAAVNATTSVTGSAVITGVSATDEEGIDEGSVPYSWDHGMAVAAA